MGNMLTDFFNGWFGKQQVKILVVGLDGVGKTTILYRLKLNKLVETIPTIGCNIETVDYRNISFSVVDLASHPKFRPLWRYHFGNTQGLIFVVDSTDHERIDEAKYELMSMLQDHKLQDALLLILANKQDLPNALSTTNIIDELCLQSLKHRKWHVQATCAVKGTGIYDGLEWLSSQLNSRQHFK